MTICFLFEMTEKHISNFKIKNSDLILYFYSLVNAMGCNVRTFLFTKWKW